MDSAIQRLNNRGLIKVIHTKTESFEILILFTFQSQRWFLFQHRFAFSYVCLSRVGILRKNLKNLEKIHVRAAKITIFGWDWYTSSDKVLDHANWFSSNNLYDLIFLLLAYKCFHQSGHRNYPEFF